MRWRGLGIALLIIVSTLVLIGLLGSRGTGAPAVTPVIVKTELRRVNSGYQQKYVKEANDLWTKYVPKSGPANTVQGELIRAVARLRDEAQRNGNMNWDAGYKQFTVFLNDTLSNSAVFDAATQAEIRADIKRLQNYDEPYTEDDIYARLSDHVVEWCQANPTPVERAVEPNEKR